MIKEIAPVSNIANERFVHRPDKSYKGDEPFIFVSYRHNAWPSVYPVIKKLIDSDYRVWYDDGIDAGSEWPESIQEHLEKCNVFMPFITNDFCNSKNCRREVVFADESNKFIVPIFMEDAKLTQGMGITLASCQAIYKYQIVNEELFYERLFEVFKDSYDVQDRSSKHETLPTDDQASDLINLGSASFPSRLPSRKVIRENKVTLVTKLSDDDLNSIWKKLHKNEQL